MAESPTNQPGSPADPGGTISNVPPRSTVPEATSETLAGDALPLPAGTPPGVVKPSESGSRHLPSLAGFEVLKELGRGGMGVVYLVRHCQMNRTEALKMILAGDHASQADLMRFQTEARTVASLHHSNFVRIYDVGESGGHPYLRLEYVGGGNLEDWLDGRLGTSCLAPVNAARHVENLARAMHHMHEKGMVHRDLKPANVLIDLPDDATPETAKLEECELKISDFGLAREVRGPGAHTQGIIGTPAYMAPEQATGASVDRRVDVYALGAILYRLLTGRAPHEGDDPLSVLARLIQPGNDPVPPSQLRPEIPAELDTICLKSLDKDPARRHATARELADDLRRFREGGNVTSAPPTIALQPAARVPATTVVAPAPQTHAGARSRGRRIALLAALMVIFMAVGSLGYIVFQRWSANRAERRATAIEASAREKEETEATAALNDAKTARKKGDKKGSLQNYWKAQELYEKLREHYPAQTQYTLALARAHIDEGSLWLVYREPKEAEADFAEAIELLTKHIPTDAAGDDVGLALADAYHHRGELQESLLQRRKALQLYQDALTIRNGLWWKNQSDRAFRRDVARSYSSIGDTQLQLGHMRKARESYEQALKIRQQLVSDDSGDEDARYQLARSYINQGQYFLWRGDLADSEKQYAEARNLYEALLSGHGDSVRSQAELAGIYLWLAELRLNRDKPEAVPELVAKARAIYDEFLAHGSDELAARGGIIRCNLILARLHVATDPAAAVAEAAKTIEDQREYRKYLNAERQANTSEDTYNNAVARALQGDRELTLSSLKSAVSSYGYRNFTRLRLDVAFRTMLAKDADFKRGIDNLEQAAKKADAAPAEEEE